MLVNQALYRKIDLTIALNGAIAGLVAITAGPDLQNHLLSIIVGAVGGALVVFAIPLLDRLRIDDVVGAISAHLVAGVWGTLAVGIFGDGNLAIQALGVIVVGVYMAVASAVLWLVLRHTIGIRASEDAEDNGLDRVELGLEAYPEFGRGSQTV
ncbi:MAG: ammonium transporter, partial [Kiloniellales bacterium]